MYVRNTRVLIIAIVGALFSLAVLVLFVALDTPTASAHGTCATHHPYKVTDGHGHDGDGDGVGCERNPLWPDGSSGSSESSAANGSVSAGYDRDNWSYQSSPARRRLGCRSDEHVDHVVALKEAYDSGAATWSAAKKEQFANDPLNQWCLDAGVNISKSDKDLAEWDGGSCGERKFIASATIAVKQKYGLSTDAAEQTANAAALASSCSEPASTTRVAATTQPQTQRESSQIGASPNAGRAATAEAARALTAADMFADRTDSGIKALWKWDGSNWQGYAVVNGVLIPGSVDFKIESDDILVPVY